ncbi:TOBE domain-containing protein [Consotaella aegiceratis]|uniref:TOBE domain-containing protein n=1 Tax=Consotaella aegiceratis TaxID=3097961 RepID=UPI002F42ED8B
MEALISLRDENRSQIGRERIQLLEAVAREGSITAGAKAVGLTYKAAWDALDAMANLFGQPLLEKRTGGRAGGGATLTPAGIRIIQAYHRMESEMARVMRTLEPELAGTGISPINLISGFLMKTSARNALRGPITAMHHDALRTEVEVEVAKGRAIHAIVTNASVRELGLCVGREATMLIKAPFVAVAVGDEPPKVTARNVIPGTILRCERSAVDAEAVIDIGGDKTLAATITARSAEALGLEPGRAVFALFEATHVIVAID